jgi:hypothetical protein
LLFLDAETKSFSLACVNEYLPMSGLLRTTLLGLLAFLAIAALGTGGFLAGDLEFS